MPCPSSVTVKHILVASTQSSWYKEVKIKASFICWSQSQRDECIRSQGIEITVTPWICVCSGLRQTELTDFPNLPVSVTVCVFISQSRVMETLEERDSLTSHSERSLASPPTAPQGTVSVRLPSAAEISQLNLLIFIPDKIRSLIIQMSREQSCFN